MFSVFFAFWQLKPIFKWGLLFLALALFAWFTFSLKSCVYDRRVKHFAEQVKKKEKRQLDNISSAVDLDIKRQIEKKDLKQEKGTKEQINQELDEGANELRDLLHRSKQ